MTRVTDIFESDTPCNEDLYRRMDNSCTHVKKNHTNQTPATKARSTNFGIAARAGKALREGLHAVIPYPTDRSMQSRFSGAIAKWLGLSCIDELPPCDSAPYISDFQFTNSAAFNEQFKVPVSVSRQEDKLITVIVDAFVPDRQVTAPAGTVFIELGISVAACDLETGTTTGSETQRIQLPYNGNKILSQVLKFITPERAGSLTVTAAWLQYYVMKNNGIYKMENPGFMPARVISACYC
ncbi:MAG: hypothetical protein ACRDE5_10230 [Ginsengibacter sp.]